MADIVDLSRHPGYRPRHDTAGTKAMRAARVAAKLRAEWWAIHEGSRGEAELSRWREQAQASASERAFHCWQGRPLAAQIEAGIAAMEAAIGGSSGPT